MHILVVTHYFPPEVGAPQARLSEFARMWADQGHTVTVLTGMPNHPTGRKPPQYKRAVRRVEQADGYRIVRTWLYATPNEGVIKKTLGHLSFMVSSVLLGGHRVGKADVVIGSSPTFFCLLAAWLLARVKRARFVVEVRDLWPAIFVELGVLTNHLAIGLLERLELATYRAADAVVVVSQGFRDQIAGRGIRADKLHVIRNGVDLELFPEGTTPDPHLRATLGARSEDCLILYIGTHGVSQALSTLIEAASHLRDRPVHFAFVGQGSGKQRLIERVHELGLTNVTLLPPVARSQVPAMLGAADVCLVPLRNVPLFRTFIPSKLFELLAAEKAVIGAVAGEAADLLRQAGAMVVPPEDPERLAQAIGELLADPGRRTLMGKRGRTYVAEHADRQLLARRYTELFRSLRG